LVFLTLGKEIEGSSDEVMKVKQAKMRESLGLMEKYYISD
jgi:hypothetical protein